MLVYGDHRRTVRPRERLAGLARTLDGPDRREALDQALIDAGELAQGLADAEFEASGVDEPTSLQTAAMALCVALGRRLYCGDGDGRRELAALAALPLPSRVRCKVAEGYAFYAVTPDAYAAAARAHDWGRPPLAIGLRTIGTSLAAVVAAVTGGSALSLRPRGHPFHRRISASENLKALLRAHTGPFAIVDEGPGLSGSSFGAVADLLEALGIGPERIVFMPSHAGPPGPQASSRHRACWASAVRVHRTLDDLLARDPVAGWFPDLIGAALGVEDLSAGAWRHDLPPALWPPAFPAQERRKFRLTTDRGVFLARFAGLGTTGEEKFQRAELLARAGHTPEPIAIRRGFLLERWIPGSPLRGHAAGRRALAPRLARYLAFRAREFPAEAGSGADLRALRQMAVHNAAELCDDETAWRVNRRLEELFDRSQDLRPVYIDGRLQPWEWRLTHDGRLYKTDALDHADAHDLIGPQDIAWDIAGASVEFGLSSGATERLVRAVAAKGGVCVDRAAVAAFSICYAAFQGGLWSLAEGQAAPKEAARIAIRRKGCASYLAAVGSAERPRLAGEDTISRDTCA